MQQNTEIYKVPQAIRSYTSQQHDVINFQTHTKFCLLLARMFLNLEDYFPALHPRKHIENITVRFKVEAKGTYKTTCTM